MNSTSTSPPEASAWRGFVFPGLAAGVALATAVLGAMLTGDTSGIDRPNAFVETLSGRASHGLDSVSVLVPLGFAFAAGMVSTVNPCGFAMLPAYLGLYLGSSHEAENPVSPVHGLARALVVGAVVTAGFVALFGVVGTAIGAGARSIVHVMPWLGLATGVLVAIAGAWLLGGGKLYSGLASRAASHIGDPNQVSVRGYFLFGISYGVASLSCTLPIFLVVVVTTLAVSGVLAAMGQFLLYSLGMGLVIMAFTVWMALFQGSLAGKLLRGSLRYFQPFSALLMIVAGSYIVYYWLTIGDLGKGIQGAL